MGAHLTALALVSAALAAGGGQASLPLGEALVAMARQAGAELAFLGPAPTVQVAPSLTEAGDMSALLGLLDRQGLSYAVSTGAGGTTRVVVVTAGLTPGGTLAGSATAEQPGTTSAVPSPATADVAAAVPAPGDTDGAAKPELPADFVSSPEVVLFEGGAEGGTGPDGFRWSPMEPVGTSEQAELPGGFVNTPPQPSAPPGPPNPAP